jgi:hypothetical protein
MNLAMRWVVAGLCALTAAGGAAQTAEPAPAAAPASMVDDLKVKEVGLAEIDISHIKLSVDLNLTAAQSVTMESLRISSLRINGLPVFAAPLNQEIVLKKGVSTALPPLYVTVLFRDLHTVEPLKRMIENQSVKIEGNVVADLRLNMVEKLALHTQHPTVEATLSQEVPATLGISFFERTLALSTLGLIDSGLQATSTSLLNPARPAWLRELEAKAPANLLAVESSYALTQEGASIPVVSLSQGFRVASGKVVTSAEADAPWKYDAEFLTAVQSGAAKLVKGSQEILLRSSQPGDPLRLSAKDFTVDVRGSAEGDSMIAVSGDKHGKIQLLRRGTPGSLVLLTLAAPSPTGAATTDASGLPAATAAVVAEANWEQVAVFRLREDATTKKPSFELLTMAANRDGKSIHLSEPVDAAVFGSPIVTPDGVIGLVQDEQTGTFLPDDLLAPAAPPAAVVAPPAVVPPAVVPVPAPAVTPTPAPVVKPAFPAPAPVPAPVAPPAPASDSGAAK